MPELRLDGCTLEPLMSYLKALGVLRLVSKQADPQACGAWQDGVFLLETKLDREAMLHFFLREYCPTPIVAPWAGGSGFFGADNRTAVDAIAKSKTERLTSFAAIIAAVRTLLKKH